MADDKKCISTLMARVGGSYLGDHLLEVANYGADTKGRSASKILDDLLADPSNSLDGQDVLNLQTATGSWVALGIVMGPAILGTVVGPLAILSGGPIGLAATLTAIFWPPVRHNRIVRLFVINGFDQPITVGTPYMDCGQETAECARCGLASDGKTVTPLSKREIPPVLVNTDAKGVARVYYGVGMFEFEKNTTLGVGFYGTAGALSFSCASPRFGKDAISLAFINGFDHDVRLKLAPSLDIYGGDLAKFYKAALDDAQPQARAIDFLPGTPGIAASAKACFDIADPVADKDDLTQRTDLVICFQ